MGGGKDQKQANQQLAQQQQYQSGQQKSFDTRNTGDLDKSGGRADELYGALKGGYQSLIDSPVGQGGGGGGGGNGYQAPALDPRYANVESMYKGFMDTGGWDPSNTKSMGENISGLKDLGKGGMSPEDMARFRGGGVYDEFSKTGGLSDKDQSNIRARGTSGIPAAYAQMNAANERGRKIQGGYGPGAAVLQGRMGRQQTGQMADAALNAELGIKQQVNQGRQWGAQGMTDSEGRLQSQLGQNKLGGLMGAANIEQGMVESQMGGKQWGTGGYKGMVDEAQQRAENQAAMAASGGGGGSQDEFALQQKMAGLEGLGSLYAGSGSGEYNTNKGFALGSAGGYGQEVRGGAVDQKSGNVDPWDNVAKIGGAVAGGLTGIGALGSAVGGAARGINPGAVIPSRQTAPQYTGWPR